VLADIAGEAAERRAEQIRQAGGAAVAVATDVSDEAQVERMVQTARSAASTSCSITPRTCTSCSTPATRRSPS
jgi:NAD(P)-dependent dehydrogenase (short-subunit alcohol dehydrogenase family)